MDAFACPPDCGYCCSHLSRDVSRDEDAAEREFRAILRDHGVYHCPDAARTGLSLSNDEARALLAAAKERGMRLPLHPRTYLLDSRRRVAVVLAWHMPRASCPMLVGFRCSAYDARPLACRAYPVLIASPLKLAPDCPKVPVPKLALGAELRAKRAIDRAHAALDAQTMKLLATPDARFAEGLTPREAWTRLRRYRNLTPEEFTSSPPRTRSTR